MLEWRLMGIVGMGMGGVVCCVVLYHMISSLYFLSLLLCYCSLYRKKREKRYHFSLQRLVFYTFYTSLIFTPASTAIYHSFPLSRSHFASPSSRYSKLLLLLLLLLATYIACTCVPPSTTTIRRQNFNVIYDIRIESRFQCENTK